MRLWQGCQLCYMPGIKQAAREGNLVLALSFSCSGLPQLELMVSGSLC